MHGASQNHKEMEQFAKSLFAVSVATLALVFPSTSQLDSTNLPFTLPAREINITEQVCPPNQVSISVQSEIAQDVQILLDTATSPSCQAFQTQFTPAVSCSTLPTSCPSDFYWIRSSSESAVQVYCDMDRVCGCNGTGAWTRVAFLNMTDPNQQCPGEWMLQNYTTEPRRLCGASNSILCSSAMYSTYGISYSRVCGRMIGYQFSAPDAFATRTNSIDSFYVDGVSLTYGPPGARQHIWSFTAGFGEGTTISTGCPCADRLSSLAQIPSFVGNDFFCESGNPNAGSAPSTLFSSDPLWDGQGCASPPCCELNYPPGVTAPWFCKQLPQTTTDDIEARICGDGSNFNAHTPVELVELYIR